MTDTPDGQTADAPANVLIERRVAWEDTDASGHYHHGSVIRWVEEAEAVLQERLGIDLFGRLPRVHYEVDYLARLWFSDLVEIRLAVADVGRTSVRFTFEVFRGEHSAARGKIAMAHVTSPTEGPTSWPDEVRKALLTSGEQRAERFS